MATKMNILMKKAEAEGYSARLAASTLSLKQFGCQVCRKNTAVKFVHNDESHAVLACLCGWRKRTTNLR